MKRLRMTRAHLLHLVLLVQVSLAVTYTIAWSYRTGSLLLTTTGAFLAWTGFILAHRVETGRFVDAPRADTGTVERQHRYLVPGILMMVAAFPVASLGIHLDAVPVILAGELTFFTGFVIGHHGLTGSLY